MDINSDKESSPIFKLFTPRTASKENGNINKTTENTTATQTTKITNNDFDDCSQLPDGLKKCVSTALIGRPLDDPFYANKETFVVVNNKKQLFRFSSTNALGMFAPTSAIRSNAVRIITHPFYAIFMVLMILTFCLMNATVRPTLFDM
ncbi:hypothetical protein HA402_005327 [Bradysia odoriphaga]|nr:hypothetical protein HA402_005327 [Bradysia odoriphaga]